MSKNDSQLLAETATIVSQQQSMQSAADFAAEAEMKMDADVATASLADLANHHGFLIIPEIVRGAFGVVYAAYDRSRGEVVALKTIEIKNNSQEIDAEVNQINILNELNIRNRLISYTIKSSRATDSRSSR